ncbi:21393_t:CDS:2 [Dentiscutata erythropus]|uniref:21393_t:CDS:1 n=1 Tax=Dentiscutata erythropus TaxID=1348616 RepID=A0A9N9A793_9GLOM|nr:21393_t:CDS:2 [Dentiscutata erythropus]
MLPEKSAQFHLYRRDSGYAENPNEILPLDIVLPAIAFENKKVPYHREDVFGMIKPPRFSNFGCSFYIDWKNDMNKLDENSESILPNANTSPKINARDEKIQSKIAISMKRNIQFIREVVFKVRTLQSTLKKKSNPPGKVSRLHKQVNKIREILTHR